MLDHSRAIQPTTPHSCQERPGVGLTQAVCGLGLPMIGGGATDAFRHLWLPSLMTTAPVGTRSSIAIDGWIARILRAVEYRGGDCSLVGSAKTFQQFQRSSWVTFTGECLESHEGITVREGYGRELVDQLVEAHLVGPCQILEPCLSSGMRMVSVVMECSMSGHGGRS